MTVYTLGLWSVSDGHEEEFVAAWTEMAQRTKESFPRASGTLVRDLEQPGLFISFGPWESTEQVAEWRASPAFTGGVAKIRAHLDGFEPHSLDLVVHVE